MVLVFTRSSNVSHQVRFEVERAASKGKPILPFRTEDVLPSEDIELFLSSSHWLDAMTPPAERHLERLSATVQHLLQDPDADSASRPCLPPEHWVELYREGERLMNMGQHAAAQVQFAAIDRGAGFGDLALRGIDLGDAYYNYGMCLQAGTDGVWRGPGADLKKARQFLEKAVELGTSSRGISLLHLTILANLQQDYTVARRRAEEGIRLEPWNYEMHGMLGAVLMNLGQYTEAIAALEKCLQINPEDCDGIYNLATARATTDDSEGAVEAYQRFLTTASSQITAKPYLVPMVTTARRELDRLRVR